MPPGWAGVDRRAGPVRSQAMRWLPLLALVSCQLDRAATSPPATPPALAAPRPTLAPPPLTWDLSEQAAFERLDAAGFRPRADLQRGYFTSPDQGHAAPGTIAVDHTTEPVVVYTPRPGWTGVVHYPSVGGAMDSIEERASLTPATATAELRALERRHGPPADRRVHPAEPSGGPGTERLVWVRDGVWLVALASPDGALSIAYRRDPRPASDIVP